MSRQTIKSHEFLNKNRVELVLVQSSYALIGEVSSFAVYFLEYNEGPYLECGKEDHHYMVCNTVHFPLTNFIAAVECFQLYLRYYGVEGNLSSTELWNQIKHLPTMYLEEIKSLHDSLFQKTNTPPGTQIGSQ